jgi:pimeloyl-ACP methyl ester carboxylesterase
MYQIITVIFLLLISTTFVSADKLDRDREKMVADKLVEEIKGTEVLWLEANGEEFLALFNTNETDEIPHGAAIILHGMGAHPDWPQTISPIREALPTHGWITLSIQLPVIAPENQVEDYGKTLEQAVQRIEAAVNLLRERKFLNIVTVGHSFGAASALAYLEKEQQQKVMALVAIGLQDYAFVKPSIDILDLIEKSKIPVLDIFGSRDFKEAINQAADRRLAATKGNNNKYEQLEIEGADHYFTSLDSILIKRTRGWLEKAAPGVSILVQEEDQ